MPVVYAEWFDRAKGKQLLYQARFCTHDRHDQSENRLKNNNTKSQMGIASLCTSMYYSLFLLLSAARAGTHCNCDCLSSFSFISPETEIAPC